MYLEGFVKYVYLAVLKRVSLNCIRKHFPQNLVEREGLLSTGVHELPILSTGRNSWSLFYWLYEHNIFWDILQRALKKDVGITQYTMRFLPFKTIAGPPYDTLLVLGLCSVRRLRLCDHHDENPRSARSIYCETVAFVRSLYAGQEWLYALVRRMCVLAWVLSVETLCPRNITSVVISM